MSRCHAKDPSRAPGSPCGSAANPLPMRHLYLLRELVRRDLTSRYRGSLLGFLWAFLHPVWQLVLYSVVFSLFLRIPLVGEKTQSFPAFLFAGLVPWLAFAEGVTRATTSILEHAALVKKLRFPSELLVLSTVLSTFCHQLVALAVFAAWQGFCGALAWERSIWLLVGLIAALALSIGCGLIGAALQVFFRDVAQAVGIVLGAWFYLTPIVYPPALLPEPLRPWLEANPAATIVALFRTTLLGNDPPQGGALLGLIVVAAAALGLGLLVFARLRSKFADEL